MLNFKIKVAYYFLSTIFFFNFFSTSKSHEINHNSLKLTKFPEKSLSYKFSCGLKKIDCHISIKKKYLHINNIKLKKNQIKNINSQLMCKSEFGISRCIPDKMKNIALKKITLIYNQEDSLKAKLIFIKDLSLAKSFKKELKAWLGWNIS